MLAARRGHWRALQALCEHGADVTVLTACTHCGIRGAQGTAWSAPLFAAAVSNSYIFGLLRAQAERFWPHVYHNAEHMRPTLVPTVNDHRQRVSHMAGADNFEGWQQAPAPSDDEFERVMTPLPADKAQWPQAHRQPALCHQALCMLLQRDTPPFCGCAALHTPAGPQQRCALCDSRCTPKQRKGSILGAGVATAARNVAQRTALLHLLLRQGAAAPEHMQLTCLCCPQAGTHPLMLAVQAGSVADVKLLLQYGVAPQAAGPAALLLRTAAEKCTAGHNLVRITLAAARRHKCWPDGNLLTAFLEVPKAGCRGCANEVGMYCEDAAPGLIQRAIKVCATFGAGGVVPVFFVHQLVATLARGCTSEAGLELLYNVLSDATYRQQLARSGTVWPPPLWRAAQAQCGNAVQMLLAAGAAPDVTSPHTGLTLLALAARIGDTRLLQLLLRHSKRRVDFANASSCTGVTPLMLAAKHGFADAVDVLLAHGACAGACDHNGHSAEAWALRALQTKLWQVLSWNYGISGQRSIDCEQILGDELSLWQRDQHVHALLHCVQLLRSAEAQQAAQASLLWTGGIGLSPEGLQELCACTYGSIGASLSCAEANCSVKASAT